MSRQPRLLTAGLLGTLLLSAAACSSDGKSSSLPTVAAASNTVAAATTVASTVAPAVAETTPATTPATTAVATTVTAANTDAATVPPASAGGKVNINSADISELESTFKAAGVSNARRWAQEVDEYRPYATDPTFAKLRQELGKYNIDPAVLEKIISTLEF